jgi:HPt (histidine-containing phosphotransfer) domain-containing protein
MRSELDAKTIGQIRELGGQDLLVELVQIFLAHAPRRIENFRQGVRSGDLAQAEKAIHSFRSSSVSLGASRVAEMAAELERLAKQRRGELLAERLPEFEKAVEVLLDDLRMDFGSRGE